MESEPALPHAKSNHTTFRTGAMKLSAYIVRTDAGFSPNPFWGRCTLACCKPMIRLHAEPGDIVVGSGSRSSGLTGRLIYAMRVDEVLPYEVYWHRYPSKRPSLASEIRRRGDNVWFRRDGAWHPVRGALHDRRHQPRDISGQNALIAREFYYFGRDAVAVPESFRDLLATTQGHKNTYDPAAISRFWRWLERVAPKRGRIGTPNGFNEAGCEAHRTRAVDD